MQDKPTTDNNSSPLAQTAPDISTKTIPFAGLFWGGAILWPLTFSAIVSGNLVWKAFFSHFYRDGDLDFLGITVAITSGLAGAVANFLLLAMFVVPTWLAAAKANERDMTIATIFSCLVFVVAVLLGFFQSNAVFVVGAYLAVQIIGFIPIGIMSVIFGSLTYLVLNRVKLTGLFSAFIGGCLTGLLLGTLGLACQTGFKDEFPTDRMIGEYLVLGISGGGLVLPFAWLWQRFAGYFISPTR